MLCKEVGVPRLKCFTRSASVAATGYSEQCCDNTLVRELCCSDPESFSYKDFRCGKMISSKVFGIPLQRGETGKKVTEGSARKYFEFQKRP